jgi:hypothetical protein
MTHGDGRIVTEDREVIDTNVRRIVGIAALRRIHRIISDRAEEERIMRRVVAPLATLLMIVIAALIWHFGGPREASGVSPLECSPPASERISVT